MSVSRIEAQATLRWYDDNACAYATASNLYSLAGEIDVAVDLLPPAGRILDAGCGGGRDTEALRQRGFEVVGMDISQGLLAQARRIHPNCTFVQGDLLQLPFPDAGYDGVWSVASLVHFATITEVKLSLVEFGRVLRTNGILFVSVKASQGSDKTAVVFDRLANDSRFFRFFSPKEAEQLIADAGFQIVKARQYKETDNNPKGRPEVEWLSIWARKIG